MDYGYQASIFDSLSLSLRFYVFFNDLAVFILIFLSTLELEAFIFSLLFDEGLAASILSVFARFSSSF